MGIRFPFQFSIFHFLTEITFAIELSAVIFPSLLFCPGYYYSISNGKTKGKIYAIVVFSFSFPACLFLQLLHLSRSEAIRRGLKERHHVRASRSSFRVRFRLEDKQSVGRAAFCAIINIHIWMIHWRRRSVRVFLLRIIRFLHTEYLQRRDVHAFRFPFSLICYASQCTTPAAAE